MPGALTLMNFLDPRQVSRAGGTASRLVSEEKGPLSGRQWPRGWVSGCPIPRGRASQATPFLCVRPAAPYLCLRFCALCLAWPPESKTDQQTQQLRAGPERRGHQPTRFTPSQVATGRSRHKRTVATDSAKVQGAFKPPSSHPTRVLSLAHCSLLICNAFWLFILMIITTVSICYLGLVLDAFTSIILFKAHNSLRGRYCYCAQSKDGKTEPQGVGKCWDLNRGPVTSDSACTLRLSSLLPPLCDISLGLVF